MSTGFDPIVQWAGYRDFQAGNAGSNPAGITIMIDMEDKIIKHGKCTRCGKSGEGVKFTSGTAVNPLVGIRHYWTLCEECQADSDRDKASRK